MATGKMSRKPKAVERETRSGRQTKDRILETAIRLFNEHGTQDVSTKRIAKEMGISPGNLYYHYRNKEEIIRAIVENKFTSFAAHLEDPELPPERVLLNSMEAILCSWKDYQFFKKELATLLERDPELKKWYRAESLKVQRKMEKQFERLAGTGILRLPEDPKLLGSLLSISTLISDYWLSHLSISDLPVTTRNLRKGLSLIFQVWRPYLSDEVYEKIGRLW